MTYLLTTLRVSSWTGAPAGRERLIGGILRYKSLRIAGFIHKKVLYLAFSLVYGRNACF